MRTFVQRYIDVTLTLASSSFDGKNSVLKLSGLRVSAKIKAGGEGFNQLEAEIFGLSSDVLRRIIGMKNIAAPWANRFNQIRIEIYTSADPTRYTLFNGEIINALADFNSVPDVPVRISASEIQQKQSLVITPKTFAGAAKVVDIMKYLAGQCGASLEVNGVDDSFILRDHTVQGSAIEAIEMTANAAQIDWAYRSQGSISNDTAVGNILIICKRGTPRKAATIEIHEASGLVGYPVMGETVNVKCLFNPQYWMFNQVKLFANKEQSILNGNYLIREVSHHIDSESPDGQWISELVLGWMPEASQKGENQ